GRTVDGPLIRRLTLPPSRNTPLVGAWHCPHGTVAAAAYASSQAYRELGTISGYDLTPGARPTRPHGIRAPAGPDRQIAASISQRRAGELPATAAAGS